MILKTTKLKYSETRKGWYIDTGNHITNREWYGYGTNHEIESIKNEIISIIKKNNPKLANKKNFPLSHYYPNILTSMFLFFNVLILFVYRTNLNILRYKIADSIIPIKDD